MSIVTMSPAARIRRLDGIPWTISSLIEMHADAGKP
jgi:hypothetical protein